MLLQATSKACMMHFNVSGPNDALPMRWRAFMRSPPMRLLARCILAIVEFCVLLFNVATHQCREGTKMKQILGAVVAVAVLAALPGVVFAQDGPVMKRIAETKIINIGHRDASVPLSYLGSDGKVQGYSIDICLKIADAAKEELKLDKIDVKFVPLNPQTRIPLITAGTVDIICETSTHTLGRLRR
jgi:Bacterial extracellular solute-binding proteins, family 3